LDNGARRVRESRYVGSCVEITINKLGVKSVENLPHKTNSNRKLRKMRNVKITICLNYIQSCFTNVGQYLDLCLSFCLFITTGTLLSYLTNRDAMPSAIYLDLECQTPPASVPGHQGCNQTDQFQSKFLSVSIKRGRVTRQFPNAIVLRSDHTDETIRNHFTFMDVLRDR
jgi:hypothetical protein